MEGIEKIHTATSVWIVTRHQKHCQTNISSKKWCIKNWVSTCTRLKLVLIFHPLEKIHLKWNKDLNIKPETLNLMEENIGKSLQDIHIGNDFLNRTWLPQISWVITNKRNCINFKIYFMSKKTIIRVRRQHPEWKKNFQLFTYWGINI
jgi:hypothetical protein